MVIQSPLARWDPVAFPQMLFIFPSQHLANEAQAGPIAAAGEGERRRERMEVWRSAAICPGCPVITAENSPFSRKRSALVHP